MPETTPTGRYILAAFLAGMIAGGGLVAMPLYDAVQRVERLETGQGVDEAALHAEAGRQLTSAAALLGTDLDPGSEQHATLLRQAAEHIDTAGRILEGVPPPWPFEAVLEKTERVLGSLAQAHAHAPGIVDVRELPTEPSAPISLGGLAAQLATMGDALAEQQGPGRTIQTVDERADALDAWLGERLRASATIAVAERVTLPSGAPGVQVSLEGLAPAPSTSGAVWAVQLCAQDGSESGACLAAPNGTGFGGRATAFTLIDADTVELEAPASSDTPVTVRVQVQLAGYEQASACTIPVGSATTCTP